MRHPESPPEAKVRPVPMRLIIDAQVVHRPRTMTPVNAEFSSRLFRIRGNSDSAEVQENPAEVVKPAGGTAESRERNRLVSGTFFYCDKEVDSHLQDGGFEERARRYDAGRCVP